MNNPKTSTEIEAVIKYLPKIKAQDQIASHEIFTNIQRSNAYTSKTFSKNCRGRNIPKLILQGYHHPDIKTRQRQHIKRKLQVNVTYEHRSKNPQQNFSTQNSTAH